MVVPVEHNTGAARAPDSAATGQGVYDGRSGQLNVRIPHIEADAPVDGTLAAAPWRRAAVLTGFSEYQPADGVPAEDSTEVLVWYSARAIYFGIRAYEVHGAVHATLANRDQIDGDDNIQLDHHALSPCASGVGICGQRRWGVQEDGTITEASLVQGAYGIATHAGPPPTDLSPDFVYDSRGHLTPWGYEVVVRIPFRSVRFQNSGDARLGHQHCARRAALGTPGHVVPDSAGGGVLSPAGRDVERAHRAEPWSCPGSQSLHDPEGDRHEREHPHSELELRVERPQLGGNVRWGITNNLLLNGTFRPDFAEVESDATQVQFDPRNAVSYPKSDLFSSMASSSSIRRTISLHAPDHCADRGGETHRQGRRCQRCVFERTGR